MTWSQCHGYSREILPKLAKVQVRFCHWEDVYIKTLHGKTYTLKWLDFSHLDDHESLQMTWLPESDTLKLDQNFGVTSSVFTGVVRLSGLGFEHKMDVILFNPFLGKLTIFLYIVWTYVFRCIETPLFCGSLNTPSNFHVYTQLVVRCPIMNHSKRFLFPKWVESHYLAHFYIVKARPWETDS